MSAPQDDHLYEVHVTATDSGPWQHVGSFNTLESARVAAVHLIADTDARFARVMHVVEYYGKPPADD